MTKKKRKPKPRSDAIIVDSDGQATAPTPERVSQAGGNVEQRQTDTGRNGYRINDDILAYLLQRNVLDQDHVSAGSQYREDYHKTGLDISGVIDPTREVVDGGGHHDIAAHRLDAMTRFNAANLHLGKALSSVVTELILFDATALGYAIRYMGISNPKTANEKVHTMLKFALSSLADHYMKGQRRPSKQRIRAHMNGADRPVMPVQADN